MELNIRRALFEGYRALIGSLRFGSRGTIIWDSWDMWLLEIIILPLAQISFFEILATYANYSPAMVQYVVIGNAIQTMSFSSVFAVANITSSDKWQGTLPSILLTPASRASIIMGRALYQIIMSTLISTTGLLYAYFLFGVNFSSANYLFLAVSLLLTSISMISFGLLISTIGLYMRTAMIVANVFLFIGLLVCGVNFPISELPVWLRPLSYVIPLTYGLDAVRLSIAGAGFYTVGLYLLYLVIDGLAVFSMALLLTKTFERLARKSGRLEIY